MTEIDLHENEKIILARLYKAGEYMSRSDIVADTRLNRNQVNYATEMLYHKNLLIRIEDETRGDINNAYAYRLNDEAENIVRERSINQTKRAENSERIDSIEDDILRLNTRMNALERQNEELEKEVNKTKKSLNKLYESVNKTLESWKEELF